MWLQGKHNAAKVFAKDIDESAKAQIIRLCDQDFVAGSTIRIMPDVHAGKGSVIGLTMDVKDCIVPNLVGVDIGCGMHTSCLGEVEVDLEALDAVCRKIPSGHHTWDRTLAHFPLEKLRCYPKLKKVERLQRSLGTLGGGNHFIELNQDEEGRVYLVVHSGSRNLGTQVAGMYQRLAQDLHGGLDDFIREREILKKSLAGQDKKAYKALKSMRFKPKELPMPADLAYLSGEPMEDYLHDAQLCQDYAEKNRRLMSELILDSLALEAEWDVHTIHNYLDIAQDGCIMLRKGAISARKDERVLIPLNMRDGSLLCRGLGNPDWNESAPHGAGRRMSRKEAKSKLSLEDYQAATAGIVSSSVSAATLDEAPMAYKPMEAIAGALGQTVELEARLKSVYNFKDSASY